MAANTINDHDPKVGPLEPPFIKFFTAGTTNGQKVAILLELLGLKYILRPLDIKTKENKEEWFLKINPNGKIPTITDANAKGEVLSVAESGNLLLYIATKYDTEHKFSYPESSANHWKETEFLFFHVSYLNPNQANYNVFKGQFPEYTKALQRFTDETERAYSLFEEQLASTGTGYLVGDHISLADIVALPHARGFLSSGLDVSKYPLVAKWVAKLESVPAIKKALTLV